MIDYVFDIFSGQFIILWQDNPASPIPQAGPDVGMPYGLLILLTYPAAP